MRVAALMVAVVTLVGCHDRYKEMQEKAAAAASASAAAAASALAAQLSADKAAKPPPAPPTSIVAQQILIAYQGAEKAPKRVRRTREEARLRAQEVRAKAVTGSFDFTDLARLYSDDPSGQEREGTVGRIERKDVVKPFADAAFALKVNEVSPVVETQFGFHIIKRNQ
jgi:NIMA-interacting peptidyl-prolyl cis-trans isomerase 1